MSAGAVDERVRQRYQAGCGSTGLDLIVGWRWGFGDDRRRIFLAWNLRGRS